MPKNVIVELTEDESLALRDALDMIDSLIEGMESLSGLESVKNVKGTLQGIRRTVAKAEDTAALMSNLERAEIARVYGPDLVDYVLKQRESNGIHTC